MRRHVSPSDLQQRARWYRQRGYQDGRAGRAAASKVAEYQDGWRRGRETRERDLLLNDLDDAS